MQTVYVSRAAFILAAAVFASDIGSQQTLNCNTYNTKKGPFRYGKLDPNKKQHITGNHSWANELSGTCSYTGLASFSYPTACAVHSTSASNSGAGDTGLTTPYVHQSNFSDKGGTSDGPNGGTAKTDAEGVAAINSCPILPCGVATIAINGAGTGGGFNVTFSPTTPLWTDTQHYSNTCGGYTLPALQPTVSCPLPDPPDPPYELVQGFSWVWDTTTCSWKIVTGPLSPIVIDTTGKGFKFTDPAKGEYVSFDMEGHGVFLKVSWPESGSGNAWLVLDRDGDGVIKDGTEMFGNFTPHSDGDVPNHPNPNGFLALAWYDQIPQGGDVNLVLDKRDAIWPKLKLWIDEHCYKERDKPCRSLPSELHSLASKRVTSISLVWDVSPKVDAVGNQYKFFAVLNPEAETREKDEHGHSCCDLHQRSKDGRVAYDVYVKMVR